MHPFERQHGLRLPTINRKLCITEKPWISLCVLAVSPEAVRSLPMETWGNPFYMCAWEMKVCWPLCAKTTLNVIREMCIWGLVFSCTVFAVYHFWSTFAVGDHDFVMISKSQKCRLGSWNGFVFEISLVITPMSTHLAAYDWSFSGHHLDFEFGEGLVKHSLVQDTSELQKACNVSYLWTHLSEKLNRWNCYGTVITSAI